MAEKIDFENMVGSELLEYISLKDDFPTEAELAFCVFRDRYQRDILQKSEIQCSKFGYSEAVAFLASNCTFEKVWKNAQTFDMKKANTKNVDRAILFWMYKILLTQIILFRGRDTCEQPTEEEDLSIVTNIDELIEVYVGDGLEKKKDLRKKLEILNGAFSGLSEKHKIIYLTYIAYAEGKKRIPRTVSKKLKEQLDLTQNSIRVYKMEAKQHISNYIGKNNGKR